jgi:CheY-like chemotaxis protein
MGEAILHPPKQCLEKQLQAIPLGRLGSSKTTQLLTMIIRLPNKGEPMKARTGKQPIRVVIADDHPIIREGLAAIFRSENDIKVVAEATDGEEACQLYDQLSPDVLLLDLRMPKKDALQVVIELMSGPRAPKPWIIVMATYEEEEDIHRTLSAGARGYVLKAAPPEYIRRAVRRAAGGEKLLSSKNYFETSLVAGGR